MAVSPGNVFKCNSPPNHRYVVLTPPDEDNEVLLVNLTTRRTSFDDQGCILQKEDYPEFITTPTAVRYSDAGKTSITFLQNPFFVQCESISAETLKKIRDAGIAPQSRLAFIFQELIKKAIESEK